MLKNISKPYSDIFLVLFVLCVASLLFVPLPTILLDLLIAFNIALSLLLLLIGLSLPNALSLLSFPTLLLLTTLFRLSLNVASTRLILGEADAGSVIRAFGTFLIQSEVAIGMIIFIIITVVNFIVITRGASRISEVAARFVLDAMPGKQLAIDSDLRSGLISAEQAKAKREELRKETQLFGSMDGAMKFVQGDAIAGFFITVLNIFGGMYFGLRDGMGFSDAVQTYTTLTIGDGLVTQIPALLISICAGVVVTRVSSTKESTLSSDLLSQLFQSPKVLSLAALIVLCIAALPGLPVLPFVFSAGAFLVAAYFARNRASSPQATWPVVREVQQVGAIGKSSALEIEYQASRLQIQLPSRGLVEEYQNSQSAYHEWWETQRNYFQEITSIRLPDFQISINERLNINEYKILHDGYDVVSGVLAIDSWLVAVNESHLASVGIEAHSQDIHPINQVQYSWIKQSEHLEDLVDTVELDYLDPLHFVLTKAIEFYLKNPEESINVTFVHSELKDLENHYPGLFAEILNTEFISPARITAVINELIKTGFPVSNLKTILEALSSYCSSYGQSLVSNNEFDLDDIVSFIRQSKKRLTLSAVTSAERKVRGIVIDEELLAEIVKLPKTDSNLTSAAQHELEEKLQKSLDSIYNHHISRSSGPLVLLCPAELRRRLLNFVNKYNYRLNLISNNELDNTVRFETLAVWS